jgi:hypothetical protein
MSSLLDRILDGAPRGSAAREVGGAPAVLPYFFHLVVGGGFVPPPPGVRVLNHFAGSVHHFHPTRRARTQPVDELVIHETQSGSVEKTVETLRAKGASVHLIVGPDGRVTQHGDLLVRMGHAEPHNTRSVGIEVVNPYVASRLHPPWTETIPARWSAGGYVLPTPRQAEVVAQLIGWLTRTRAGGLAIPRDWIGEAGGHLAMSKVDGAGAERPGVYAHTYFCPTRCGCRSCREDPRRNPCRCKHADGAWLVLYAWLRLEGGLAPGDAYDRARELGRGARRRRVSGVPGDFPVPLPERPRRLPQDPMCVVPLGPRELEMEAGEACVRAPVSPRPVPGRFDTLRSGVDRRGLLDLAGRAYGVPAGALRQRLARRINEHPYNRRFWKTSLASASFPGGRISFSPAFTADVAAQARAGGAAPRGHAFATIWIPPAAPPARGPASAVRRPSARRVAR